MTIASMSAARRAQRLVRCYPAEWRTRYGDEFTALLIDDINERPRSLTRTMDVLRTGLLVRLTLAGLAGHTRDPLSQMRASLAALGCMLSAFLVFGIAMWSQLTIGWQWSRPSSHATASAMVVMSCAVLCLGVLALLAAAPLAWTVAQALLRGDSFRLLGPMLLMGFGAAALALGSDHFGHGWPGTGGHPWADRGLVPSQVASFAWAATLWVTSYWAHLGALSSFPAGEIAWMAASPFALLAVFVGGAKVVRRLPLSPGVLRYEMWIGSGTAVAMAAFLAGACSWVISGSPAPRQLFRVGTIDGIGLIVMTAALVVVVHAVHRALAVRPAAETIG